MAASAIALTGEILPIVLPVIKSLIGHIKGTDTKATTPTVVQTISSAVQPIVQQFVASGIIPKDIDPTVLSGVIETLIHLQDPVTPSVPIQSAAPIPASNFPFMGTISGNDPISPSGSYTISGSITLTPAK